MFASWLRRQGLAETPPDPEAVGLYLASQVERRRRRTLRLDPRAAAVRDRLALPSTRRPIRHPRPAYRHRACRHPPPPRPPALTESRDLRRRTSGDAGDAGHGSAGLARPGDPGDRLRRRPPPLGNRRARLWTEPNRGRLRLDRNLPRRGPPDHPRQDRLARGRDRPGLPARHLPGRPAGNLDAARTDIATVPYSGRLPARTAASLRSASPTSTSSGW